MDHGSLNNEERPGWFNGFDQWCPAGLVLDSTGLDVTHEIQTSLTDSTFCYKTRMILILEDSTPGWKS